ncbi:single-stranded DNA-binding protein [Roseofilum casamattae]|uniref:Single-stranded DNA-binding protein n=1 Tax=Roseofilum casamattae BLCC-M143 TaxID=3022442 RepID=A0ABT7BWG2_9CYAN|nr:single-stranded DNA-binding protein [Roseofilum casamattae]MDJ1183542.1 single-stranded DNA-binding protein [Roseofilum casamattae BLCC-M143]
MNSCILMCQIIQDPQLRYTPDETAVAEMLVQFAATKAEDPPHTLKAVAWGNLGEDVSRTYHQGDRIIIQGSLRMSTFDRPEGFKEKRAELNISRIYHVDGEPVATRPLSQQVPVAATASAPLPTYERPSNETTPAYSPSTTTTPPVTTPPIIQPLEEDEIPF